jgi:hypothetical protein
MQRAGQGHRAAVAYLVRAAAKYGSGVAGAAAAHVSAEVCNQHSGKERTPGRGKKASGRPYSEQAGVGRACQICREEREGRIGRIEGGDTCAVGEGARGQGKGAKRMPRYEG